MKIRTALGALGIAVTMAFAVAPVSSADAQGRDGHMMRRHHGMMMRHDRMMMRHDRMMMRHHHQMRRHMMHRRMMNNM